MVRNRQSRNPVQPDTNMGLTLTLILVPAPLLCPVSNLGRAA